MGSTLESSANRGRAVAIDSADTTDNVGSAGTANASTDVAVSCNGTNAAQVVSNTLATGARAGAAVSVGSAAQTDSAADALVVVADGGHAVGRHSAHTANKAEGCGVDLVHL